MTTGRGCGWVDPLPLARPENYADRVTEAVIDQATLSPRERMLWELRALGPGQRAQLLAECAARGDARAAELRRLAEEAWR